MSSQVSLADRFRAATPDQRRTYLRKAGVAGKARLRWLLSARRKQVAPEPHFLCDDPESCRRHEQEARAKIPGHTARAAKKRLEYVIARGHLPWSVWVILAGRGWGKTRTGAETVAYHMMSTPGFRVALVAATFQDGRDTMVEGESGLLAVIPKPLILAWNRSLGELVLKNGSRCKIFSAEEPERLRGPQHHAAWCDEVATWKYRQKTWDMLQFGLRLGANPWAIITTTPKPYKFIKKMVEESKKPENGIVLTSGHTSENVGNLPKFVVQKLYDAYANTRIGRQELAAEILEDLEGGLIKAEYIEERRLEPWNITSIAGDYIGASGVAKSMWDPLYDILARIVIAVDPAVSVEEGSAETGVVVAGKTRGPCPFCSKTDNPRGKAHAVVFEDHSGKMSDHEWSHKVANVYRRVQADRIIAEKNNGGDLVAAVIHGANENLPVKLVWASRGKVKRAEPVAACYERREVHHLQTTYGNSLVDMEDQLMRFGIEEEEDDEPTVREEETSDVLMDRGDACIWALTELMIPEGEPLVITKVQDHRARGSR